MIVLIACQLLGLDFVVFFFGCTCTSVLIDRIGMSISE